MSQDFERRLAEALTGLDQGSDMESVLAEFPDDAGELAPLLEAAARARDTFDFFEPPSTAGLASGRRRMLEAAARKRTAAGQPRWGSVLAALRQAPSQVYRGALGAIGQLFRTPARGLAMATVLLAVVVVAGGTTVVAAADSLPGDPLYGVKRTGERVRLALTTDPATRASLHARFNRERQTEARAVANLGRRARLQFEGVLERRVDGTWVVDGMELIVDPILAEGEPARGSNLVLDVVSPGDGTLHVAGVAMPGGPHSPAGPTTMPGGPGPMHEPGRLTPSATPTAGREMPATRVPPTPHPTQSPMPAMPTRPAGGGPMMSQETASPQPTPEPGEPTMGQPTATPEPTHGPMGPGPGMGQPTASPQPTHGSRGPEMGHPTSTAAPPQPPAPTQVPPTQVAPTDTPAPSPTHHGPMMPHPTSTPGGGHPGGPGGPGRP